MQRSLRLCSGQALRLRRDFTFVKSPAPLKMTTWIGWRTGEDARLSMNDSAGTSLREVPAPLKMTTWIGWWTGEDARLSMNGSSGISLREVPAPLRMTTWIGWLDGRGRPSLHERLLGDFTS